MIIMMIIHVAGVAGGRHLDHGWGAAPLSGYKCQMPVP